MPESKGSRRETPPEDVELERFIVMAQVEAANGVNGEPVLLEEVHRLVNSEQERYRSILAGPSEEGSVEAEVWTCQVAQNEARLPRHGHASPRKRNPSVTGIARAVASTSWTVVCCSRRPTRDSSTPRR